MPSSSKDPRSVGGRVLPGLLRSRPDRRRVGVPGGVDTTTKPTQRYLYPSVRAGVGALEKGPTLSETACPLGSTSGPDCGGVGDLGSEEQEDVEWTHPRARGGNTKHSIALSRVRPSGPRVRVPDPIVPPLTTTRCGRHLFSTSGSRPHPLLDAPLSCPSYTPCLGVFVQGTGRSGSGWDRDWSPPRRRAQHEQVHYEVAQGRWWVSVVVHRGVVDVHTRPVPTRGPRGVGWWNRRRATPPGSGNGRVSTRPSSGGVP